MSAITFNAVVSAAGGNFEWIKVPGEALPDGLVLHPSIRSTFGRHRLIDSEYTISDIASGCKLFANDTRDEVLTDLAEYRSRLDREQFLAAVAEGRARCLMIYGHPPASADF